MLLDRIPLYDFMQRVTANMRPLQQCAHSFLLIHSFYQLHLPHSEQRQCLDALT
jgi:hypothetical protein